MEMPKKFKTHSSKVGKAVFEKLSKISLEELSKEIVGSSSDPLTNTIARLYPDPSEETDTNLALPSETLVAQWSN